MADFLATLSWEYSGCRNTFELSGPPGLPVVSLSLELPTHSRQGTLYGVIRPRQMMLNLCSLRVYIPAAAAPPTGVFHFTVFHTNWSQDQHGVFGTRWVVGLSLISTVDDREVHLMFTDESDFTIKMLHILAAVVVG